MGSIDIGTNSVLLTIAESDAKGALETVLEDARITRIGEGLGKAQLFLPRAMERTTKVLGEYVKLCQEHQVDKVIAVGTAAFRRALNAKEFVSSVAEQLDLTIEIISGEREAELSYAAAERDFGDDVLVVDIGGGSTEFIWNDRSGSETKIAAISLPIGSVVLHEQLVSSDPINDDEFYQIQTYIMTELLTLQGSRWGGGGGALKGNAPTRLVALAGTATTLAAMELQLETYSHAQVHQHVLKEDTIANMVKQLRAATVADRKQVAGIEPARADVILEGAILLHETMKMFSYDEVSISDRGVRWGLIYELCS